MTRRERVMAWVAWLPLHRFLMLLAGIGELLVGLDALLRGEPPVGGWTLWFAGGVVLCVLCALLWWAQRALAVTLAYGRILGRSTDPTYSPLNPSGLGPQDVWLHCGSGVAIPLFVMPLTRIKDGPEVWLAYGPPGDPIPPGCELHVGTLPGRCEIILQIEEDDDGLRRFIAPPRARSTVN